MVFDFVIEEKYVIVDFKQFGNLYNKNSLCRFKKLFVNKFR